MPQSALTYAAVFEKAPLPMLLLLADEPRFTILAANDAYCKITYVRREQIVGKTLFEVFPLNPDDRAADGKQKVEESIRQAISGERLQPLNTQQYDIRGADGITYERHYWNITNTPVFNAEGRVTAIIHCVEDVTESVLLKEREAASQTKLAGAIQDASMANQAAGLLQAIIDTAQAGIFLFTPLYDAQGAITDFRFRMANKMLAAYVGRTSEEVTGGLGSEWFPGYKTNGLFDRYSATAKSGVTSRFEFHYDDDGIDVWLDIMSTKVGDDVLVTFTDHTSLKNLQRRQEEHLEQLRASNTNLEQFAYIASHDLQEPLRKIKSFGDILQSRYGSAIEAGGADLIVRMQTAAERMGTLINDLLTYSRVSVKPVNPEIVDLNEVLAGVLLDLEQRIRQKKAVIRAAKLAPALGQGTQLGQLFLNLLSNALKFQHPGRDIEITISSAMVKGRDAGTRVAPEDWEKTFQRIIVQDNGIGFEPAYRERIFQIFQRLHGRSEYPGTGVGLSIVKKVVENHHGYVAADGVAEEGATFTILLPAV